MDRSASDRGLKKGEILAEETFSWGRDHLFFEISKVRKTNANTFSENVDFFPTSCQ